MQHSYCRFFVFSLPLAHVCLRILCLYVCTSFFLSLELCHLESFIPYKVADNGISPKLDIWRNCAQPQIIGDGHSSVTQLKRLTQCKCVAGAFRNGVFSRILNGNLQSTLQMSVPNATVIRAYLTRIAPFSLCVRAELSGERAAVC